MTLICLANTDSHCVCDFNNTSCFFLLFLPSVPAGSGRSAAASRFTFHFFYWKWDFEPTKPTLLLLLLSFPQIKSHHVKNSERQDVKQAEGFLKKQLIDFQETKHSMKADCWRRPSGGDHTAAAALVQFVKKKKKVICGKKRELIEDEKQLFVIWEIERKKNLLPFVHSVKLKVLNQQERWPPCQSRPPAMMTMMMMIVQICREKSSAQSSVTSLTFSVMFTFKSFCCLCVTF